MRHRLWRGTLAAPGALVGVLLLALAYGLVVLADAIARAGDRLVATLPGPTRRALR